MPVESVGTPLVWTALIGVIFALLALDLGVFHRKAHAVEIREAALMSIFWVIVALLFNVYVYFQFGEDTALEFLTGYIIEKALSVDNIFVFAIIFTYFQVPRQYQHRVLFFGILGALVLRGIFIVLGTSLLHSFAWITYIFGALLVFTGIKLLKSDDVEIRPDETLPYRLAKRFLNFTEEYDGGHFFLKQSGKILFTPLMLVLIAVEATDVVFAIDSVPAIFAITTDPFVVFSSNIFAIFGLRALYFLLENLIHRFIYLKLALAFILVFVGVKMIIHPFYVVPIGLSLSLIVVSLIVAITLSLIQTGKGGSSNKP